MDSQFNNCVYLQPQYFPYANAKNLLLCFSNSYVLLTEVVPDLHYVGDAQCFPLYWYEEQNVGVGHADAGEQNQLFGDQQGQLDFSYESDDRRMDSRWVRHDAITNTSLKVFRDAYPNLRINRSKQGESALFEDESKGSRISKEDIFYYVYRVLHSPEYRRRFENNLKKELPRIPLAKDFKAFMNAGRALADLHLNYESAERYPLEEVGDSENPGRTEKMRYPNKVKDPETGKKVPDRTVLQVAEHLTVRGIPLRAYDYVVNGKSAIGWLIDRYRVAIDQKSGIVNDPNEYSEDPRYIVDLVERIVTVSMKTLDIIDSLPPLNEQPHPASWPIEWNN